MRRHATTLEAIKVCQFMSTSNPKEDVMEIVVIGGGVTQFLKAVTFDYGALGC